MRVRSRRYRERMRASQRSNGTASERRTRPEPGTGEHRPTRVRRRRRHVAAVTVAGAALLAGVLAGCTATGGSSADAPAVQEQAARSGVEQLQGEAAFDASGDGGGDGGSSAVEEADRSVVTTGEVAITVDDPIEAAADAAEITRGAGGRVDSRIEHPATDTQPASASLTLRIPADVLDAVLEELRDLGDATSVSMQASDVTAQHQDLDARIAALTTSIGRMTALMAVADDVGDLIAVESELTARQAELDGLTQQRDQLDDLVAYSTVTVGFSTVETAPAPAPDGFLGGLLAGWNGLLVFLGLLGIALGVILPWALAALVVAAVVIAVVRLVRGRSERRRARTGHEAPASDADPGHAGRPGAEEAGAGEPSERSGAPAGTAPRA